MTVLTGRVPSSRQSAALQYAREADFKRLGDLEEEVFGNVRS